MDERLQKCIDEFYVRRETFQRMDNYYRGKTDAMKNYKMITARSNNKAKCNFIKKFIKEEVDYILGNKITYISKSSNEGVINSITLGLAHWSEKHDKWLLKNALKFSESYELYYIDKDGFSSRVLSPLNSYVLVDDVGNVELLIHFFEKKFEDGKFFDVYTENTIEHYKDNELIGTDEHYFGTVPVGICQLSEEKEDDTLFNDLKGLQDAYETNLSDITNEISDFRNAYLKLIGCQMSDEDFQKLKELGGLEVPKDGNIDWLIKNINDTFVQNTLRTLKENMYEIANHINANEKLQSNTSSLALRTRLINLEQKCKGNTDAVIDCIKARLKFLFIYLNKLGLSYDFRDIKVKFTPSIPQDDLMMAQIVSQVGDKISTETGIAQFSFVENPKEEIKRIKKEQSEIIDLDMVDDKDE